MNLPLLSLSALPPSLFPPVPMAAGRSLMVGNFEPDPDRLQHFNELLTRIRADHPLLEGERLAGASRELIEQSPDGRIPACIRERVLCAGAVDRMLSDPDWDIRPEVARAATTAIGYMHSDATLIPNTVPVVGWLDDAILLDAAWPLLADELRDHLDFCRLRKAEAALRGEPRRHFGFTREQLDDARLAEALWQAHQRHTGTDSYLSADTSSHFRVN